MTRRRVLVLEDVLARYDAGETRYSIAKSYGVVWAAVNEAIRFHRDPEYKARTLQHRKEIVALAPDRGPRACERCAAPLGRRRRRWCPDCALDVRIMQFNEYRRRRLGIVRRNTCSTCDGAENATVGYHTALRCPRRFTRRTP